MIRKLFRHGKPIQWHILEKEVVDEVIFRTRKLRNRLMLELMARGGMRVGEVLKLVPNDIEDRKVIIRDPNERAKRACPLFILLCITYWPGLSLFLPSLLNSS